MTFRDPADPYRIALLTEILDRMDRSPIEESRIRALGRKQLELQRSRSLSGRSFQDLWDRLLDLPLEELRATLLAPGEEGREVRHAHMFAGCVSPRDWNRIRAEVRETEGQMGRPRQAC